MVEADVVRDRAVPCRGATLQESIRGSHKTWADDGYCNRCRALNAQARLDAARLMVASSDRVPAGSRSAGDGVTGLLKPSSTSFPASSSSRYATGLDAPAATASLPRTSQVER